MPPYSHDDNQNISCVNDDYSHLSGFIETEHELNTNWDTIWAPTTEGDPSSEEETNEIAKVVDGNQNSEEEANEDNLNVAEESNKNSSE